MFNQGNLLRPRTGLELFFTRDCVCDVTEILEVDESIHSVLFRESVGRLALVLPNTTVEAVGNASIEGAIFLVRQDLDKVGIPHFSVLSLRGAEGDAAIQTGLLRCARNDELISRAE